MPALPAGAAAALAFPLRAECSLCFPRGGAGRAEPERAALGRSGHLGDSQLSLSLSVAPAGCCSQGCRVCALISTAALKLCLSLAFPPSSLPDALNSLL